jgi:hypothetical protein
LLHQQVRCAHLTFPPHMHPILPWAFRCQKPSFPFADKLQAARLSQFRLLPRSVPQGDTVLLPRPRPLRRAACSLSANGNEGFWQRKAQGSIGCMCGGNVRWAQRTC